MKVYIVQMCDYDDEHIHRVYLDYDKAMACMHTMNRGRNPYVGHYVVHEHEVIE